jgi:rhodanese-related sulfurtransferase
MKAPRVGMIAVVIFSVIALVIIVAGTYSYTGKGRLNAVEASAKIKSGEITTVVDVRSDLEWAMGHYPMATHIPITSFSEKNPRIMRLLSQSSGGILTYCNTGQRSRRAAELLRSYGARVPVYYLVDSYGNLK